MATTKRIRHVSGLQARANPAINYVKDLLSEDYLGKVLSVNVSYFMPSFPTVGDTIDQAHAYLLDQKNDANQLTQYKEVTIIETAEIIQASAPDYVVVNGKLLILRSVILLSE